jgi:hypothetical protein
VSMAQLEDHVCPTLLLVDPPCERREALVVATLQRMAEAVDVILGGWERLVRLVVGRCVGGAEAGGGLGRCGQGAWKWCYVAWLGMGRRVFVHKNVL